MPLYEYKCISCEHVEEYLQRFNEEPLVDEECPVCGHVPMNKIISRSDFHLKGTGWYKDGYA